MFNIQVKNALDEIGSSDGCRIMVDGTLPSGYDEYKVHIDMWAREALPSNRVLKILNNAKDWGKFEEAYFKELDTEKDLIIQMVVEKAKLGKVTLLHNSDDMKRNNAVALRDYLISREKILLKEAA